MLMNIRNEPYPNGLVEVDTIPLAEIPRPVPFWERILMTIEDRMYALGDADLHINLCVTGSETMTESRHRGFIDTYLTQFFDMFCQGSPDDFDMTLLTMDTPGAEEIAKRDLGEAYGYSIFITSYQDTYTPDGQLTGYEVPAIRRMLQDSHLVLLFVDVWTARVKEIMNICSTEHIPIVVYTAHGL